MENKILHGDSLDLLKDMDDNSVDMILTDLPYFRVVGDDWDNQWETENDYFDWLEKLIEEYDRILKIILICFYSLADNITDT